MMASTRRRVSLSCATVVAGRGNYVEIKSLYTFRLAGSTLALTFMPIF